MATTSQTVWASKLIMPISMEPAKPDRLIQAVCEHTEANVQE